MSIEPAEGISPEATEASRNPWMDRSKTGLVRGWLRTVINVLADPGGFIRSLPARSPLSEGVLFAGISAALGAAIGIFFIIAALVFQLLLPTIGTGGQAGVMAAVAVQTQVLLMQLTLQIASGVLSVVCGLVAGFVAHGLLVILGGAREPLSRSVPAILYSQGASAALNVVVCCSCNAIIAPIWWCVAMTVMLQVIHGVSRAKAVTASILAALTWMVAVLGTTSVLTFAVTLPTPGGGGVTGVSVRGPDFRGTKAPYSTPLDAVAIGGMPMRELLELIAPGEGPVTMGGLDRNGLIEASTETIETIARSLEAVMPPDDAPFRLGRAVFCYRDAGEESKAWHVIVIPSGAQSLPKDPSEIVGGSDVEWTVIRTARLVTYDTALFTIRLAEENARRERANRPPLPDPMSLPDLLQLPAVRQAPAGVTSPDAQP
jgi:hypothetical protein